MCVFPKLHTFILIAVAVQLLSACAPTYTTSQRYPAPVIDGAGQPPPAESPYPPAETYPTAPQRDAVTSAPATGSSAVVALLDRADQQHRGGDLDAAAASLERALRIEPRNALLWHRLARVRLEQGQPDQTVQLAAKSNSLAGGDTRLQASNWRLIASARKAQGDTAGARNAEQKARHFE